jgi:DNA-binding GntR family transcriptional regulator
MSSIERWKQQQQLVIKDKRAFMLEADRAYDALRLMIVNNDFRDGYPILDKEIAKSLGMSRTPVREAIQRLKAEGLLDVVPRKGVYVKRLTAEEIRESYEFGEALEGMVAYLAAERANIEHADELQVIVDAMDQALESRNIMQWISMDEEFHTRLWAMCGNRMIENALRVLYIQIHRVRIFITAAYLDKVTSNREHRQLIEVIKAGNAEASRRIHQKHWRRIRDQALKVINDESYANLVSAGQSST